MTAVMVFMGFWPPRMGVSIIAVMLLCCCCSSAVGFPAGNGWPPCVGILCMCALVVAEKLGGARVSGMELCTFNGVGYVVFRRFLLFLGCFWFNIGTALYVALSAAPFCGGFFIAMPIPT